VSIGPRPAPTHHQGRDARAQLPPTAARAGRLAGSGRLWRPPADAAPGAIRKAEKSDITIEHAAPGGFAEEYYGQLLDVFGKQGMKPTYRLDRVKKLIEHIHPSGDLLLARARPGRPQHRDRHLRRLQSLCAVLG